MKTTFRKFPYTFTSEMGYRRGKLSCDYFVFWRYTNRIPVQAIDCLRLFVILIYLPSKFTKIYH